MSTVVGIFPDVFHGSPTLPAAWLADLALIVYQLMLLHLLAIFRPDMMLLCVIQGVVKNIKISGSRSSEYTCTEIKNFRCKLTAVPVDFSS